MKSLSRSLACLISLAALLLAGGCGGGAGDGEEALRIAMIPKGTSHVFWKSIHAGGIKAQRELAGQGIVVDLIWKGPLKEDDRASQISVVENFISQQVDGIVLAPLDEKALVAPVEKAARAGVPTTIIDSGLQTDQIVSYVATDNFEGGQLAGEHLAKLLGGEGDIILLRYQEGSASTDAREAGFLDALSKYPDIKVLSDNVYAGATRATAQEASENLLNRYGAEVEGIFCPNESSTVGMLLALRRVGKAGGIIKFVGFDGGEMNIDGLRAGDIQGLVLQDPLNMGYMGVKIAVKHALGQPVEPEIDTGSTLVTPYNIDDPKLQLLINPPLDQYLD